MSADRKGDWIQTFTLRRFWPLDPRAEDIVLDDIAHALSMMCRFTGHVHRFYSVAEHSVRVSHRVEALTGDPRVALWGLLHDAGEAYLVDVARPVKLDPGMAFYRDAEATLMRVIAARFGLPEAEPPSVKQADNELLFTEKRDLFPAGGPAWGWSVDPLPEPIDPWTPEAAEAAFLDRFDVLA